ncbi:MAG: L-aspartate oxidase [Gammaproteobacteria bacterium]|nr:L-aspartate oxidase [Gammaproteobacteria bacterium]
MTDQHSQQILIIGAGAAGLTLALQLAERAQVTIIAKGDRHSSSTYYAQGGISAVLDPEDHFTDHITDTLEAGAGLCDPATVRFVVENAPNMVRWLESLGMPFTRESYEDGTAGFHLTREGGHNYRRVIHADDATGKALHSTLENHARAHPNITILERRIAIDIITGHKLGLSTPRCLGAYVLNLDTGRVECLASQFVILATGGASKVYLYTSNPDGATGDGIAMAWRAGCRVANMEFMQFHPTCLFHPNAKSFLISEAVRGEGGRLLLPDGTRFMTKFDERGELAPRDIVARAIDHEMKRQGLECVYLDISHKPAAFIRSHFPNIYERILEYGYDMTREPIPVVPAAHYTCGGVVVDHNGRTDIPGLYALGETACTGLHGANRLASNSLLECMVFAHAAAQDIQLQLPHTPAPMSLPAWDESQVADSDEEVVVLHNWHELRQTMWNYVGIVRTDKRLQRAANRIKLLMREINDYYWNFRVSNDFLELRNLATVADLIVRCALQRKESRGLHTTLDYPETLAQATPTILTPAIKTTLTEVRLKHSIDPLDIDS